MKKNLVIAGSVVVFAFLGLLIFDRLAVKSRVTSEFARAGQGLFEVNVTTTGELLAEKSIDILAPQVMTGGRGGGGDIRVAPMKIQDLVPEGTIVKKGDFIAQLDKTDYDNSVKDDRDRLTTLLTTLEVKNLDSAVTLTALRDEIRNQKYVVSEADMTLRNSKYESPEIIRQAEIALDKSRRVLEQDERSYKLKVAQVIQDIRSTEYYIDRTKNRISGTESLIRQFTILSPADGMLIYKRDFRGSKRKVGTFILPFDRIVANIPDLSSMISKTFISEIDITKIKTGQKVDISIDAFPRRAYTGKVLTIANIGEDLNNTDSKVFETQIRLDGADPDLRPSMTTSNKIHISTTENVVYIPTECIQSGTDSIPFVYTKNRLKQIIVPGISNDKFTVVEKGLSAGTTVYLSTPENTSRFRTAGKELIPLLRKRKLTDSGLAVTR